jgi:hypothetical protein
LSKVNIVYDTGRWSKTTWIKIKTKPIHVCVPILTIRQPSLT